LKNEYRSFGEAAARAISLQIQVLRCSNDPEIASAFETIEQRRIAALIVAADPFLDTRRDRVAAFAACLGVPAMYQFREHAAAGGLMSYGVDIADVYRQLGVYVGRVLNGAKVADLPVMQPI
jgi:putative tryptophan/tyrosine transport system substrate-binding protein